MKYPRNYHNFTNFVEGREKQRTVCVCVCARRALTNV